MPRKKGKPHAESELKKTISASVTPSAHTGLKKMAEEWGFASFSALLEDLGQQRIFLSRSADRQQRKLSHPLSEVEVIRDIVQLMNRLSPSSLANIIVQAGELVVRKLEPLMSSDSFPKATIAQLVQASRDVCIEMFEDVVPLDRVDAIAHGAKPTDEELGLLSSALSIDLEDLQRMKKEEFPNGSANQGCAQNC